MQIILVSGRTKYYKTVLSLTEMTKIQFFSHKTRKFYQLVPTRTIPTLKISGVPMHRHIRIDPLQDTLLKIKAVKPYGVVLDTCTGLGYTAIYAAKLPEVKKVITIEKDENVLKIAKLNEASKELFTNQKIKIFHADVTKKIKSFPNDFFDCIIHDPPTFVLAPELYCLNFYQQLYRVLKKNAKIWHYCPDPGKMKGKSKLKSRIIKNLKSAGFKNVRYDEKSSGIIAKRVETPSKN